MSIRDSFVDALIETGHRRLENHPSTQRVQDQYGLHNRKVIQVQVLDVAVGPWQFVLDRGKLVRLPVLQAPDIQVIFSYLDVFLKLIRDERFIEYMFAYDGCYPMNGQWTKVLTVLDRTGERLEFSSDIIMLRDILTIYRAILKEVMNQMLLRWPVQLVARAATYFRPQAPGIIPGG